MKKVLFFIFAIATIVTLALCIYAEEIEVGATAVEDITAAIESAEKGDIVRVSLQADLEYGASVLIEKAITVEISFNGYQISYTGTSGKDTSTAAFTLNNPGAYLCLNGANPLDDALLYTHYGEEKKADMVGTGNLIGIIRGSLSVRDAYLYATNNTFVIYVGLVKEADALVTVESSVLRTRAGSDTSAIAYRGGNSNNENIVKKQLFLSNTVEYGGFKGVSCAFNVTRGSEFINVKFYDFAIVNDSWITVSAVYANSFADALLFENCTFNTFDEELAVIPVQTETGKHNIKLWNCRFTEIVNGGRFSGDAGGTAHVFVVAVMPTCMGQGVAYSYSNPKGNANTKPMEEYRNAEFYIQRMGHDESGAEIAVYENGFTQQGYGQRHCSYCDESYYVGTAYAPIFEELGFSVNEKEHSVAFGVNVNIEAYRAYKEQNGHPLDFGIFMGKEGATLSVVDGTLLASGGFFRSMQNDGLSRIDMKVIGFNEISAKSHFVAEFYAFDGENVTYIKRDFDSVAEYIYEELVQQSNEITQAALALLESKHKLYYNESGSFKIMTVADMHVSPRSNTNEVEARIKMLVDRENPDLVVFTGDNVIGVGNTAQLRTCLDKLVGYIEEKKIPWCHVYGNHDREGGLSNEEQQAVYESYEYCISKDEGGDSVYGVGNYVHGIFNSNGTLGSVIYFLDSGTSSRDYSYEYIQESQIAWYRQASELLETYKGSKLNGIMAFHIPLIENQYAYESKNNTAIVSEYSGIRYEVICPSTFDTELFETVLERGDVKAIVTGHDHSNDYMYKYYGVMLCSAPSFSALGYTKDAAQEGSRIFELSSSDVRTYVSYIIERINPDDYGAYEKDAVIEDFSRDTVTLTTGGLDGNNLNGGFTASVVDGRLCLVRASSGNCEIDIVFDNEGYGKLGDNKYLVAWVDFSSVDFRKACFGLLSIDGTAPYRTDDYDKNSPFYFLADGEEQWVEMSHGNDGCFGTQQGSSVKGKVGYLALPIQYFRQVSKEMTSNTLITGIYFYCDVNSGVNEAFYIDNIQLVEDYTTIK